jgi:hypothetical protein
MITLITEEIGKVCPIHGVNSDGVISFKDDATPDQMEAALAIYSELTTAEAIESYERNQILRGYDIAIEKHLDAKAEEAGYYDPLGRIPNIDRACSYAGSANPYQAEGQSFVAWRAAVWAHVFQVKADVEAEARTQPTIEELIAELPARVVPE